MERFSVTEARTFSKLEQMMIWQKPKSHQTSEEELRIAEEIKLNWTDPEMKIINVLLEGDAGSGKTQLAKALSADLQLPYTKVTCFADMDKTDIFGALLPVVSSDEDDQDLLEAIYKTDSLDDLLELIQEHFHVDSLTAKEKLAELVQRVDDPHDQTVQYKFYPSEIVRAMEKGYLLEIQEPTVIRDASVLVALNSALENNGMLNLPTGIIRRHPDCVVVITTNRNYQGNRPLNESLRDRMQHAEKMDLPPLTVMAARAAGKTGVTDEQLLNLTAKIIRLLDQTAKTNAIKGVAGMRSYFYWLNTYKQGHSLLQTIYPKVLYKITTDEDELKIIEEALEDSGLLLELQEYLSVEPLRRVKGRTVSSEEARDRNIMEVSDVGTLTAPEELSEKVDVEAAEEISKEVAEVKESAAPPAAVDADKRKADGGSSESGEQQELKDDPSGGSVEKTVDEKTIRKELNQEARAILKDTIHQKERLLIHRPGYSNENIANAKMLSKNLMSEVESLSKKILDLFEQEESSTYQKGKYYGTRFDASRAAYGDYRTFDKKNPPHEQPSLAVAVRVDESGSMIREGRIEVARQAALAVSMLAEQVGIPLLIYGDTADISPREQTSVYSYKEFFDSFQHVDAKLMTMKPRQNNRDGAVLRVVADKLLQQPQSTKLLINISDGQPKAMPDYTGKKAQADLEEVLKEYKRQGVIFLSAAIGEDKELIHSIYGDNSFLNISDIKQLPRELLLLISRFI